MQIDKSDPEDFINALVVQKNNRSAALLDAIIIQLSGSIDLPNKDYTLNNVIEQTWEHPCPAYTNLRKKIRLKAKKIINTQIFIQTDTSTISKPDKEVYRW